MSYRLTRTLCLLALVLTVTGAGCSLLRPLPNPEAETLASRTSVPVQIVSVASCWPALPFMEDLINAYDDEHDAIVYQLVGTHSAQASHLVEQGAAEIAIIATSADDAEPSKSLALDPVVVVVPSDSLVQSLAKADIAALFAGYRLNWAELGGNAGRPELVVREAESPGRVRFEETVMGHQDISSAARLLPNDEAIVTYIASHANAVGVVGSRWLTPDVHVIAIDGILPTPETIGDGSYAPLLALQLIIGPRASEPAQELARFAASRQGRALVAESYTLPETR